MTQSKYEPLVWAPTGDPATVNLTEDQWERISECFPAELRPDNDESDEPGQTISKAMEHVTSAIADYQSFAALSDDEWKIGATSALRNELNRFSEATRVYSDAIACLSRRAQEAISSSIDPPGFEPEIETARIARLTVPDEEAADADREAREALRDRFSEMRFSLPDLATVTDFAVERLRPDPRGRDTRTQSARFLAGRLAGVWHGATGFEPLFSRNPNPESYCALVAKVFDIAQVGQNSQTIARYVLENEHAPSETESRPSTSNPPA